MLVLSNDEMMKLLSYDEMLETIEEAYAMAQAGTYVIPERVHIDVGDKNLLYMPCFLGDVFGTKLLTIFPENVSKGIPALDGVMLLNDKETGAPLCLMDGKLLTALRTGAVGGLAIRYTTPKTLRSVGLVGAGAQGLYQLLYACRVRPIESVWIYDGYKKDLSDFVARLRAELSPHISIKVCENATQVLERSEAIITATTATEAVLPNDAALLAGKHFVGIGSYKPHMRELPDALFPLLENVYIDTEVALEESGDLIQPMEAGLLRAEQIHPFGALLEDSEALARVAEQTSFVKAVGSAIFDVAAAARLYRKAAEQGLGTTI